MNFCSYRSISHPCFLWKWPSSGPQITCPTLPDSARDFLCVKQYCRVPIFDKFPDVSFKSMLCFDWPRALASIWNLAWAKSHLLIGFPQSWIAITMVAKTPQIIKHIVRALNYAIETVTQYWEKYFWNPNPELLLHSSYSFWPKAIYQWQRLGLSKYATMKNCEKYKKCLFSRPLLVVFKSRPLSLVDSFRSKTITWM